MKKITLISSLLLCCSMIAHAQTLTAPNSSYAFASTRNTVSNNQGGHLFMETDSTQPVKNAQYYREKSKNLKIAGFCFIGAGAIGLAIGLASFPKDANLIFQDEKDQSKADRATTITIIGSALLLGSIPFFVVSNVNKKKAKLYLNSEKTGMGIPVPAGSSATGMTLSIPLGK